MPLQGGRSRSLSSSGPEAQQGEDDGEEEDDDDDDDDEEEDDEEEEEDGGGVLRVRALGAVCSPDDGSSPGECSSDDPEKSPPSVPSASLNGAPSDGTEESSCSNGVRGVLSAVSVPVAIGS